MTDRKNMGVRILRKGQEEGSDFADTTPAERIGMMWQLAQDAWAFSGKSDTELDSSKHVIRIHRRIS